MKTTNILTGMVLALAVAAVFVAGNTMGETVTWDGDDSDAWYTDNNWDRDSIPTDSDTAHIDLAGATVNVDSGTDDGNTDVGNIEVLGNDPDNVSVLNINSGGVLNYGGGELHIGNGTVNVNGGLLRATSFDALRVGDETNNKPGKMVVNSGTFKIQGSITVGDYDQLSPSTIIQNGGSFLQNAGNGSMKIGSGSEYLLRDGTFEPDNRMVLEAKVDNEPATFTKYGSASATFDDLTVASGSGTTLSGVVNAVIDRTGYTPMTINGNMEKGTDLIANLEVGLDGGVMLNASDQFTLANVSGTSNPDWDNTPDALWNTTTNNSGVSVQLDSTNYQRGTLDASVVGDSYNIANPSADGVHGYFDISNLFGGEDLELALQFSDQQTEALLTDLSDDLEAAGYTVFDVGGSYDIGLAITSQDTASSGYFAYDFSEYTGSALELDSIAVVPEPGSLALLLFGALALIPSRRRRA